MINLRTKETRYRPSNGTEGDIFMGKWCAECVCHNFNDLDADPCPILGRVMAYSVEDDQYPDEWTYNDAGEPICTAFKYEQTDDYRCPDTIDLFGEANHE